jgi:hypothetical protein
MAIRVYRYGLLSPTENADLVRAQMRAAHVYRNTLVEIERGRRAAIREVDLSNDVLGPLQAVVDVAETEMVAALAAVKGARSSTRTRSDTEEQRTRVKAARQIKRAAVQAWRAKRAELRCDGAGQVERDLIEERVGDLRRNARAYSGLGKKGPHRGAWGTYLLIEDADMAARKAPLYDGTEPNDPGFSRWDGDGQVGVQIQKSKPMLTKKVFGSDTRLRIDPVDERAWHSESRGERRRMSRTILRIRVGSEGRAPIWASWAMIMHRDLPEGGEIKRANVSLRRRGPREEWSVEITVNLPELVRSTCGKGAVAIDLGWRIMGEEIRVARWVGSDGADGELRLPARVVSAFGKVESLRSIRSKAFDAARDALVSMLPILSAPTWFVEATGSLSQWRSEARLSALARRWRVARWEGDAAVYDALEAWRYHDYHLWSWESNQALSVVRRRKDLYRCFAADLAKRYATVVLEDFDLRVFAKRQLAETATPENETARHSRQIAAVSELRTSCTQAFIGRGGNSETVPAHDTSRICHNCGSVERYDQAAEVCHACSACGVVFDQDDNAGRVLLVRWEEIERLRAEEKAVAARNGMVSANSGSIVENRWARAKRMGEEKAVRKGIARKPTDNAAE